MCTLLNKMKSKLLIKYDAQLYSMSKNENTTAIFTIGILSLFLLGGSLATINTVLGQSDEVFKARLSGTQEVPPNESPAGGSAWVKTSGDKIEYEVNVTDIDKANAAHIHMGESGKNGPVVLTLFKDNPTELKAGKLAEANLTASNLEGPLKGKSVSDLITAIKDGKAYVNVHSTDFPDGEIRGQLNASSTS